MISQRHCPNCGVDLSALDAGGLCPRCLLALGLTPTEVEESHVAELPGPGEQVGPYRLVRALGQGGMGVVYLAEQEQPIRRTVAVKLIKIGMDTREVITRFETEQQALALLDHPP